MLYNVTRLIRSLGSFCAGALDVLLDYLSQRCEILLLSLQSRGDRCQPRVVLRYFSPGDGRLKLCLFLGQLFNTALARGMHLLRAIIDMFLDINDLLGEDFKPRVVRWNAFFDELLSLNLQPFQLFESLLLELDLFDGRIVGTYTGSEELDLLLRQRIDALSRC